MANANKAITAPLQLIPALDVKGGLVVHAAGGDRQLYRPLDTERFPSPELGDVVRRLAEHHSTFYIADLDAITGAGGNSALIRDVVRAFPGATFWFDFGIRDRADFERHTRSCASMVPIVASETLHNAQLPAVLRAAGIEFVLSLDFGANGLLGEHGLLDCIADWPDTVITLALMRVGSSAGPDLKTVEEIRKRCGDRQLIAGGGIRNEEDLKRLKQAGADAALVANALYKGKV